MARKVLSQEQCTPCEEDANEIERELPQSMSPPPNDQYESPLTFDT